MLESDSIPKGASLSWEMQLMSVSGQRGNALIYRRSGQVIYREQGLHSIS